MSNFTRYIFHSYHIYIAFLKESAFYRVTEFKDTWSGGQ